MKRLLLLFAFVSPLFAHERLFLYTYDTDPLPPGLTEWEVWLTIKAIREHKLYSAQDIRLEMEHAFTPNFSTDIYFDFGRVFEANPNGIVKDVTKFKGLAWAWIYRIPPVGFYGEIYAYVNEIKPEFKLLFSKNIQNFQIASNIIYELEYKFEDYRTVERELEFSITGGILNRFSLWDKSFALGIEFWTHSEWMDKPFSFKDAEHHALFLGPVIHYSSPKFWLSLGIYPQLTKVLDEHERINVRLILGMVI